MAKLTVKQENFCNYYIELGNASEAYRRAYSCEKMKDETVHVKSSELLNNGKVMVRVARLQKELQKRSDITKDEAVQELTNIVRFRVIDVLSAKGMTVKVKSLEDLPDEAVACISSVKKTKGGIEVRFHDKIAAIDRLSRMLGWDEATTVKVQGSVPIQEWLRKFGKSDDSDKE